MRFSWVLRIYCHIVAPITASLCNAQCLYIVFAFSFSFFSFFWVLNPKEWLSWLERTHDYQKIIYPFSFLCSLEINLKTSTYHWNLYLFSAFKIFYFWKFLLLPNAFIYLSLSENQWNILKVSLSFFKTNLYTWLIVLSFTEWTCKW